MYGIQAIEIYFPKTYVDQKQYQKYKNAGQGKYTKGLGQLQLSFAYPFEDINSISLTGILYQQAYILVVQNLMKKHNIKPQQVGRLQVGTQTLIDKSKSTKTTLMTLFGQNHDIQGATSINACYGATNALINTVNWMASPFWDGRYGIVVAADLAVYQDGPARCTGGAGAVAILLGPNPKITFNHQRATFIDHQYDFYKPIPSSEYPVVDGKLSIECYLKAIQNCYLKLKQKTKGKNWLKSCDYFCFHSPFYKMVQKAFFKLYRIQNPKASDEQVMKQFMNKVHPSLHIPQRTGNIYCGSLYSGLLSLFVTKKPQQIQNKNIMIFSYGSGLCSTMLTVHVKQALLLQSEVVQITNRLNSRIKVSPQQFTAVLLKRQKQFGKFLGKMDVNEELLFDNTFYLQQIDSKWRRKYKFKEGKIQIVNKSSKLSGMERLSNLQKVIVKSKQNVLKSDKFYKLTIQQRRDYLSSALQHSVNEDLLNNGGINVQQAQTIIENVVGILSLPYSIVPSFIINGKKYMIPMCIQQSSVVAACNSIGKLIAPYSFKTSSTPSVMIGQVHIPQAQTNQIHKMISQKNQIIEELNKNAQFIVKVGGGVIDLKVRQLKGKQFVVDIMINVCEAMGANMINNICQKAKCIISKRGIKTGIAILSNYCIQRKALSYFQIPVSQMAYKGFSGETVVSKILEAYQFARSDKFRAATHNKGILNGIDAVCVATGQDWRAVQSAAHTYASRNGIQYMPLSHYTVILKEGVKYFKGSLQIPISVGTVGGSFEKNPLYKLSMQILGNPKTTQQFSEIIVSVGLAQNLGALRALAIQGIQKGHMFLQGRSLAQRQGVPKNLLDEACKYLAQDGTYTTQAVRKFLQFHETPKL